jgi:hypothetical protein
MIEELTRLIDVHNSSAMDDVNKFSVIAPRAWAAISQKSHSG